MNRVCLFLIVTALASTAAVAGDPQINNITPFGVQRGTEATFTITGTGLSTTKEILFYEPGFTIKEIVTAKDKDDSAKVRIAVSPDVQVGVHALRLRSLGGVSNLRVLTVGNLPEVAEVEPNTNFKLAQVVGVNVTVSGVIQTEDIDHFAVDLKKGDRLNVELEGLRLANTSSAAFFDPVLSILDEDTKQLVRSDDAPLLQQDCFCSLIAPHDGRYVVQIRDVAYGGGATSNYRLHIGTFPRPTAAFPPGGRPGEKLNVRWIGDLTGDFSQEITLPQNGKSEATIVAQDIHGMAPSPNMFRVSDLPATNEHEPNDDLKSVTSAVSVPAAFQGIVEKPGDADFFRFTAKKGQSLDVKVFARKPLRSPLDAIIAVYSAQGGTIAANDDTGGPDSFARFQIPADGEYLISVRDQLKNGGPDFVYRVEVTETSPSLVIRLPERRQYISTTLVVPQSNRNAVMVSAQRQNFNGELALSFEGLPGGTKTEFGPIAAGVQEIPVLFSAATDAAPAGALVRITGKTTDPKLNVAGHLDQRTMLVRGQNNVDVWGHNADRMATVVCEAIPYSIDLVPPKAPLVRNGSLVLKVVATRAEGFKDPISLRLLYNPPGVASSGYITIPENETQAAIPLTANNGAGVGTWKICVTGRSGTRGQRGGQFGPDDALRCSTQLADLKVEEQYHKLSFVKASVEQGKETTVTVKVQKLRDFEGEATAELAGLPTNTSSQPMKFNKDTAELTFKVAAAKEAKPNRYTSLNCVTKIPVEGDFITHTIGGGELRVDAPLPAKK